MADMRSVKITIKGQYGGTASSDANRNNAEESPHNEARKSDLSKLAKNALVMEAYNTAKRLVVQSINASAQHYFSLSEDYIGEQTYQNAMSAIQKTVGFGTTVFAGAKIGLTTGGPVGAVIGATVAVAGYGATEFIQIQQRRSQQYQKLNASKYGYQFANERLQLVNGGRGTEN